MVIRRVVDYLGGHPRYADVVGVLVAADEHTLLVRRRDGELVTVRRAQLHRMREVRPATAAILELEEVAALGWPAPETEWLGRWLLRAGQGWTGRANSVLPLGAPGQPLDRALRQVTGWYAHRRLPARFQVPLPARTVLDRALTERGWTAYNPTTVLTADVGSTLAAIPDRPELPPVTLETTPSSGWLSGYHYRGGGELPAVAIAIMTAADQPVFAAVWDGAQLLGVARAVLDRDWVGVTAVEVMPAHRRRGVATHLMRAILRWGQEHRALSAYLQVAEGNVGAHELYARLGFAEHHRYHYRMEPAAPDEPA